MKPLARYVGILLVLAMGFAVGLYCPLRPVKAQAAMEVYVTKAPAVSTGPYPYSVPNRLPGTQIAGFSCFKADIGVDCYVLSTK